MTMILYTFGRNYARNYKKCGALISASGSDSFTSCFDFLHCLLNLSIMDSSTIFQALPQAAYFL